jgi:hypothetical protein
MLAFLTSPAANSADGREADSSGDRSGKSGINFYGWNENWVPAFTTA